MRVTTSSKSDQVRSANQVERGLTRAEPLHSFLCQVSIVFHHDRDFLTTPLGNWCACVQLDRGIRAFTKRWFGGSACRRASEVYAGSECMSLVADRMRIDHRFDAGGFHVSHRRFINLKTLRAGFDVSEQSILKTIRIRERFLQSFRRVLFTWTQYVPHL